MCWCLLCVCRNCRLVGGQTRIAELLDDIVSSYSPMAEPGVELFWTMDDTVPRNIFVDPLRLKQVLANGVTNALKYTKQGTVHIRLELVALAHGEDSGLLFQVIDTGPGLNGKDWKVLFDPTQEMGKAVETILTRLLHQQAVKFPHRCLRVSHC